MVVKWFYIRVLQKNIKILSYSDVLVLFCAIIFYFTVISQKPVYFIMKNRKGMDPDGKKIWRNWKE